MLIFVCLDETSLLSRKFKIDVASTLKSLTEQEDTDGNMQITIEDSGPKVRSFSVSFQQHRTDQKTPENPENPTQKRRE